jgi:hypothetical protein
VDALPGSAHRFAAGQQRAIEQEQLCRLLAGE